MDQIEARISLIFWLVGALFLAWTIEVIENFTGPSEESSRRSKRPAGAGQMQGKEYGRP